MQKNYAFFHAAKTWILPFEKKRQDMRHKWIFILMVWIMNLAYAQTFAPIGAKWYYGTEIIEIPSYRLDEIAFLKLESIKDTLVAGKDSRLIECSLGSKGQISVVDSIYVYQDGHKVYYRKRYQNSFQLLYDFGLNVGERLNVATNSGTVFNRVAGYDSYRIGADSIRLQLLASIDSFGYIYCADWNGILPPHYLGLESFPNAIIEGIGHINSFIPTDNACTVDPFPSMFLRCYEDPTGRSFRLSSYTFPCDTTYDWPPLTHIPSSTNPGMTISPNPAQDFLHIHLAAPIGAHAQTLYWIDYMGKTIRTDFLSPQTTSYEFHLEGMIPGYYFLILKNEEENTISKTKVLITH